MGVCAVFRGAILKAITLMLLIVVAVIAGKCNSSVMATPGTIMVPSLGYETIQKAVNPANPRDIMKVSSGIYYENVIIVSLFLLLAQIP